MALPENAPKIMCTLSKPLQANGAVGLITAATLSMDKSIVWTESGETVYQEEVSIVPDDSGLSFSVIASDAEGIIDLTGLPVTELTYTLRVSLRLSDNASRVVTYVFQPFVSDGPTIDLDLLPQGVLDE